MSKPYKEFEPVWIKDAPNPRSFRSIMKWGDPNKYKAPKEGLYKLIKSIFSLTDDDFKTMVDTGEQLVDVHVESALTKEQIEALKQTARLYKKRIMKYEEERRKQKL